MRIAVLLSAGRHPVSGHPCPVPVELQAIALARTLGADLVGLHAGPDIAAVREALGHGLSRLIHVPCAASSDPVPALASALRDLRPDLILAGRLGQGGEDSGLLPYALAELLGTDDDALPLVPDAAALAVGEVHGTLSVEQALGKGARRRVLVRLPALVTVHPAATAAYPFAFAQARRGQVETAAAVDIPATPRSIEERAYRKRPKLIAKAATGASAADRLKAATQAASGGGRVLVAPPPEEAAREILAHLRAIGVVR